MARYNVARSAQPRHKLGEAFPEGKGRTAYAVLYAVTKLSERSELLLGQFFTKDIVVFHIYPLYHRPWKQNAYLVYAEPKYPLCSER